MKRAVWEPEAQAALKSYLEWLDERDEGAALRAASEIIAASSLLARWPGLGRLGREPDTREKSLPKWKKVLVYRERPYGVDVLTLLDTRQDR